MQTTIFSRIIFFWLAVISLPFASIAQRLADPCFDSRGLADTSEIVSHPPVGHIRSGWNPNKCWNDKANKSFFMIWNGERWLGKINFYIDNSAWSPIDCSSDTQLFDSRITLPPPINCTDTVKAVIFLPKFMNSEGSTVSFRLADTIRKGKKYSFEFTYSRDILQIDSHVFAPLVLTNDTHYMIKQFNLTQDTLGFVLGRLPPTKERWVTRKFSFIADSLQDGHTWLGLHSREGGILLNQCENSRIIDLKMQDLNGCTGDTLKYSFDTSGVQSWHFAKDSAKLQRSYTKNTNDTLYITKDGCKAWDYLPVRFHKKPVSNLKDTAFCSGDSVVLKMSNAKLSYLWLDSSTGQQYKVFDKDTGNIWVNLNDSGCVVKDTVYVALSASPSFELGKDTFLCRGDSLRIGAVIPGASYLWHDNRKDSLRTVSTKGLWKLRSQLGKCVHTDSIFIKVFNRPVIQLPADTLICEGDTVQINATVSSTLFAQWQQGPVSNTVKLDQPGMYRATVSDSGCFASDSLQLTVYARKIINLGADTILCKDSSFVLSVNPPIGSSLIWEDNTSQTTRLITKQNSYSVKVFDGPCVLRDTLIVTLGLPPNVYLPKDTFVCMGDSVYVLAAGNAQSYRWDDGYTLSGRHLKTTGNYGLSAYINTCGTRAFVQVQADSKPVINFGDSKLVCEDEIVDFGLTGAYQTFSWNDGYSAINRIFQTAGTYILTLNTRACGDVSDTLDVQLKDCHCTIWIPNAFSPNDDEFNPLFKPMMNCIPLKYELRIYNRWGEQLFATTDPAKGWDGRYDGDFVLNGGYLWYIYYQDAKGTKTTENKGMLHVVR